MIARPTGRLPSSGRAAYNIAPSDVFLAKIFGWFMGILSEYFAMCTELCSKMLSLGGYDDYSLLHTINN